MTQLAKRPTGVTIVAIIHFLQGGLATFVGLAAVGGNQGLALALAEGNAEAAAQMGAVLIGFGIFLLVLGMGLIALGVGVLRLKRWSWIGVVVVQLLSVVVDFIGLVMGTPINFLRISLTGIMLGYLNQPDVRERFH